jgi:hypothetical protein
MPDWFGVVIAVFAVPVAFILGLVLVATLGIRSWHGMKMQRMKMEEAERQAQMDRDLLGLGGGGVSAHIEAILARLESIENRLDKVDGGSARPVPRTVPVTPASPGTTRGSDQQTNTQ